MYDVIVIGAGPGGYVAAVKAGQRGLKTLIIDKEEPGGVCLRKGCIPTKSLLASAERLKAVQEADSHGITVDAPTYSWEKMQKRKDKIVGRLTKGIQALFRQNKVEWVQGEAVVEDPGTVRVGDTEYKTKHLILATGAGAQFPDIPGLDDCFSDGTALTATELLFVEEVPEKLLIAGDDAFSAEYASLFRALGSDVTMLLPSDRILPDMDRDLSDFLKKELGRDKVEIIPHVEVTRFDGQTAVYTANGQEGSANFDKVLVSMGLRPDNTGYRSLDVKTDERGFVETDEYLRTSVPRVYMIGDGNGKYPLAHVASAEGLVSVEDILGKARPMRYDRLPMAVYSLPEVASAGLSEADARQQYADVNIHQYPMTANGKALAEGDAKGFVKILSIPPYDEVIGVHIAGNKATDLIAEGVLALQLEATVHDLAAAVHAHPTPSEIIMEAAAQAWEDA